MALFEDKAPSVMAALMRDTGMKDFHAGGILGSIGQECAGFEDLVQGGAMDPNDMSGNAVGWPQWDGSRKRAFLAWCTSNRLDWRSDEANYRYLLIELRGSERAALNALLRTTTLIQATDVFEAKFERAGVPALANRRKYAERAMAAYAASDKRPLTFGQPATHDQPPPTGLPPGDLPRPPPAGDGLGEPDQTEQPPSGGFFMAALVMGCLVVLAIAKLFHLI